MAAREFTPGSIGLLASAVAATAIGPSGLLLTTFTLFIGPISQDLSWDHGEVSALVAVMGAAIALGSPLKGWAVDRWGARPVVLVLTLVLGLATAAVAAVPPTKAALYGLFGLIGLLAPGNIPFAKVVAGWFHARRGMAYGLLGFGISLGIPLGLQVGRRLIDAIGWRGTYLVYGGLDILVVLPLILLLFRDRPRGANIRGAQEPPEQPGASLGQALTSQAFWLVVGNLALGVFAMAGLMTHGVPLLMEKGLDRAAATDALSALSLGVMLSQPLLGYLMDRHDSPKVALPFALAAIAGLVALQFGHSLISCLLALLVVGLGTGGESGTTQYFIGRYFGLRRFSLIYGCIQPINMGLAVGLGAYVLGALYDRGGSYQVDLLLMLAAVIVAAVLLLMMGPYTYRASAKTGDE